MIDFTPEQEAEIQKRIEAAKKEQEQLDEYRTAGLHGFRASLKYLETVIDKVDEQGNVVARGLFPQYVYSVMNNEYVRFLRTYFPQGAPAPEQKDKGAEDEKPEE